MYAVIETGGQQFRVAVGDVVKVARLTDEVGGSVVFDRVLMLGGDTPKIGMPAVEGASVRGTVVAQDREPKIVIYTFKKRKNSCRKTQGHRQHYTAVKIDSIDA